MIMWTPENFNSDLDAEQEKELDREIHSRMVKAKEYSEIGTERELPSYQDDICPIGPFDHGNN